MPKRLVCHCIMTWAKPRKTQVVDAIYQALHNEGLYHPLRVGSKRIPRKTSKILWQTMLARAIETAKNSQLFEQIIVSTDDSAIADIAQHHGATVSQRPAELCR